MEKMHVSFARDLKNIDFQELITSLDILLKNKNLNNSQLQDVVENISHQRKKLCLIKNLKPAHPLTRQIKEKVHTRTEYLASLRMKIDSDLKTYIPENRVAASTLKFWLDRYKKDLHKPSISVQSHLVRCIIDDREKEAYVAEAITQLQLDGVLDAIMQLTKEIDEDCLQRSQERSNRRTAGKGQRADAYDDLKLLVQAIEVSYKRTSDDEERLELIGLSIRINDLLKSFRSELRSRRTKSKNKRELNMAVENITDRGQRVSLAKDNLPMVIYDGLKIGETDKTTYSDNHQNTSSNSLPKSNSKPKLKASEKKLKKENKLTPTSSPTNGKWKGSKDFSYIDRG